MRRWWGASGRLVAPIAVEGEHELPLDDALVLDGVDDADAVRAAFDAGRAVVVRADSEEAVLAALARPEVACVLVPGDRRELADLDFVELTYGG